MNILEVIILGILEGLTEFLPISSTGHLILASWIMGIQQTEAHKAFEVAIQLGSILAVVFLYRDVLFKNMELWKRLIIAFIPTGTLGFLLYKLIKSLFSPVIVAVMLIVGGVIFLIVEKFYKEEKHQINSVDKISYKTTFFIGLFQSLAMIPGTSRSGATIIGGILLGLNRKTAAEFSFLLAVPTMFIATFYDIYKHHNEFQLDNWINLGAGFITAFIFGVISIKVLLNFISTYSFVAFGIYRIIVGLIFLYFVLYNNLIV